MSEKPEWFQITEGDQKPLESVPKSKNRLVKFAVFTAPLVLIGAVALGANEEFEDDEHAPAIDTTLSTSTNSTDVVFSETNSKTSKTTLATSVNSIKPAAVGIANPDSPNSNATSAGKVGVGVPMPTGKGGDDDREGHHEREGHAKSENHESGEHSFGDDD